MTWEDWSSEVRDTASQALGKTGHGKVGQVELGNTSIKQCIQCIATP